MNLTIDLISTSVGSGTIFISNPTEGQKTNWKIILIPKNFTITEMRNLNFSTNNKDNSVTIRPKEWKINIESNSRIISNFYYTGSDNLEYSIKNIESLDVESEPGIKITIQNNTKKDILIKPGKTFSFTIENF